MQVECGVALSTVCGRPAARPAGRAVAPGPPRHLSIRPTMTSCQRWHPRTWRAEGVPRTLVAPQGSLVPSAHPVEVMVGTTMACTSCVWMALLHGVPTADRQRPFKRIPAHPAAGPGGWLRSPAGIAPALNCDPAKLDGKTCKYSWSFWAN